MARIAGLAIMVWGIGWAACFLIAGVTFCVIFLGRGMPLAAVGVVAGGLAMAALGAGKAMGGWILVKEDRKL